MKRILITATCALVSLGTVPGQTPAKPAARPAPVAAPASVTSKDLNIRAYIELLRSDIKQAKAQIVGQVMQLDADQATRFWPIYKTFESDLARVGDQIVVLVREYAGNYDNLTDSVADDLAAKLLNIEQQRWELKKKYYLQVKDALDAVTAARFLQVENQLERLIDLQIASELPVVKGR